MCYRSFVHVGPLGPPRLIDFVIYFLICGAVDELLALFFFQLQKSAAASMALFYNNNNNNLK